MHSLVGYGWAFSAAVSSGVMDNLRKVRLFSGPRVRSLFPFRSRAQVYNSHRVRFRTPPLPYPAHPLPPERSTETAGSRPTSSSWRCSSS